MIAPSSRIAAAVQRCLIIVLVTSVIVTAVMGAVLVATDASDRLLIQCLGASALLTLNFAVLVACTAVQRRDQRPLIRLAMTAGIALSVISTAVTITLLLREDTWFARQELLAKLGTTGYALAVVLAYAGAMLQVRAKSNLVRGMAIATPICAAAAAGVLVFMLFGMEAFGRNDFDTLILLGIALLVFLLLTIIGSIAVPVALASKASKRQQSVESIDPRVQIHFGCPKCGERQTVRPGFVKCGNCSTGLFIEVEEPRCECGYLLYKLTGDTCPECGRRVMRQHDHDAMARSLADAPVRESAAPPSV